MQLGAYYSKCLLCNECIALENTLHSVINWWCLISSSYAQLHGHTHTHTKHTNFTPHFSVLTCLVRLSFQDYQEEIGVAQENKQQLQVMGERLARASQDSKAAEIQHKLSKVSERWQHLLDLIAARWVFKTLKSRRRVLLDSRVWVGSVKVEIRRSFDRFLKCFRKYSSNKSGSWSKV